MIKNQRLFSQLFAKSRRSYSSALATVSEDAASPVGYKSLWEISD